MTLPGTTLESRSRRSVPDAGTAPGRGPATHFRPLFFGDWTRALFIHYEVNAAELQQEVPFELDLWNGRAFVSLVAFTMERLRPRFWGKFGAWLFHPIATTRYLNVRTYVRRGNETGIYFIAEFVSNRLCVPLGRPTFGLPYRPGRLVYRHDDRSGVCQGSVDSGGRRTGLTFEARPSSPSGLQTSRPGSLDAFLLERYAALTCCRGKRRVFHIRHAPWLQQRMETGVCDSGLLASTGEWIHHAIPAGSHFSPGVRNVAMGPPMLIKRCPGRGRLTVFFDV